jgi:hypothetical protein
VSNPRSKRLALGEIHPLISGGFTVRRSAADVRAASAVALQRGGVIIPHPFYPDARQHISESLKGWCERPLALRQEGDGHMQYGGRERGAVYQPGRTLEQFVACRKCLGCRRWKRAMWSGRAGLEFAQAERTWLGTLTFAPDERYRSLITTVQRLQEHGVSFDALGPADKFREQVSDLWPYMRNYIKRLRRGRDGLKVDPMEFRYLVAVEPHKDGFPHFHILFHEQRPHPGVGRRQLEAEWRNLSEGNRPLGHAKFKLVRDVGGAKYAAKYLGKYETDRVKASLHYGQRLDVPIRFVQVTGRGLEVAASLAEE